MIIIVKGRQRQYKTTVGTGAVLELKQNWGYDTSDIVANIHLFKPYSGKDLIQKSFNFNFQCEQIGSDSYEALKRHCLKSNVIELEDYHYLDNKNMRRFVNGMVTHGLKHRIIFIDEIDRVFPHRFWQDREQTEALLGLWQDEKLFNYIIGTAHLGLGVDKIIRESMQIEVISETGIKGKTVNLIVLNALDMEIFQDTMENIALVQRLFYSWEPVK